jgi:O-antigen ligase
MDLYVLTLVTLIMTLIIALIRASTTHIQVGVAGGFVSVFIIWSACSIGWSVVPFISIITVGSIVAGGLGYIIGCLEFSRGDRSLLTTCLIGAHVAVVVVMLSQASAGHDPALSFSNVNSASAFLNLLWPVTAITVLAARPNTRVFAAACALIAFTGLAINVTGSRGALLGALIALAVICATAPWAWHEGRRTFLLAGAFLAGVVAAELAGLDSAILKGIASADSDTLQGTSRMLLWQTAWEMIQENPWFGIGPGVFWLSYAAVRSDSDASAGMFVHNDFLQYWIEQGLPGALLVVGIGFACAWIFLRSLKRNARTSDRAALADSASSFASIAAVAAHAMVTYNLSMTPFLLVLGLHIARLESSTPGSPTLALRVPDFRQSRSARAGLLLFLIPVSLLGLVGGAFAKIDAGAEALERGHFAEAAQSFTAARAFWSQPDYPWYLQANANVVALRKATDIAPAKRKELVVQTDRLLDKARDRNPLRPEIPFIRGLLRKAEPHLTDAPAADAFQRALAIDPRYIRARYELAVHLAESGQRQSAIDLVNEGLRIQYTGGIDTRLLDELDMTLQRDTSPDELDQSAAPVETTRLR